MTREEHLRKLMILKSGTVKSFSEDIGLAYTTVRSILERGILNAKVENVIKICNGLNIKPESLANIDDTIISKSLKTIIELQPPRQENVLNYAEKQLKKQTKENITSLNEYKEKVPMKCVHACAAGITGETLYDDLIEEDVYFYEEDIPPDADFCVLVNGDSMEPMIKNGSYAFIKSQEKVKNNTIALVILDGAGYIKRVDIYDDYIKLISLNPKYEDITVSSYNHFKIIGKVVL